MLRVLKVVALDDMADREATKLSGGQQQRLALARALVMEPPLLLLDEPLSNLDAKLRERMRFELKRLQRELGITTVYVTHDQSEALALSHSIAVMNGGRIQQIGSPREIYERPRNQFVADFVGTTNFVNGTVSGPTPPPGSTGSPPRSANLKARGVDSLKSGEEVVLSIRPEDVELSERRQDGENTYEASVDQKVFLGEFVDFQVQDRRPLGAVARPPVAAHAGGRAAVRAHRSGEMRGAQGVGGVGIRMKRWASDVIVDLLHAYELPYAALNPGRELPRPARLDGQLRRQPAGDDAVPARGDGGADRARLRQGERQADGRDPAQPRRPAARQHGDLLRLRRPRAGVHHRRDRPDGRDQAPAAHRLDPHARWCRARRCAPTPSGTTSRP